MTAVSQIIPNLLGGVSQQADPIKLPGQVREAKNVLLDPTFGCKKRPATRFVKELETDLPAKVKWFNIFRDGNEKYVVAIFTTTKTKEVQEETITADQELSYTVPASKLQDEKNISLKLIDGANTTPIAEENVAISSDGNNYTITISNVTVADGNKVKIFQDVKEPDIKIWDAITGATKHVDFTSKSRSYLISDDVDSIKPLTINDYTLLCNTERRVEMIDQKNTLIKKNPQVLVILNTVSKDTEYGIDFITPNEAVVSEAVTGVTKLTVADAVRTVDHNTNIDDACKEKDTQIFTVGHNTNANDFNAGAKDLKFQLKTSCNPGETPVAQEGQKIPLGFSDYTTNERAGFDGYGGWWGRQAYFTRTIGFSDTSPNGSTTQTFTTDDGKSVQVTVSARRRANYNIDGARNDIHFTSDRGPNLQYNITYPFERHEITVYYKGNKLRNDMWEFVSDSEAQAIWDEYGETGMTGRIRLKWPVDETAKLEIKRPARAFWFWDFAGAVRASNPSGEWKVGDILKSELSFPSDSKRHSNGKVVFFSGQKTRLYLRVDSVQTLAAPPVNHFSSQYKTDVTLLDGGEGFEKGQTFSVTMKGRTYNLTIDATSTTTTEGFAGGVTLSLDASGNISPNEDYHGDGNQASVTGVLTGLAAEIAEDTDLSDYSTQIIGNVLLVENKKGNEFNVRTRSGLGTHALVSIKNSVNDVSLLPTQCKENFVLKVSNSADSESDDYYLKFVPSLAETDGQGVWEETTAPGIDLDLDPGTMPHALIRRADGSFIFQSLGEPDYEKIHTVVNNEVKSISITPLPQTQYTIPKADIADTDEVSVKHISNQVETLVDPANVTITESGDNYVVEVKNVSLADGDTIKIFVVNNEVKSISITLLPQTQYTIPKADIAHTDEVFVKHTSNQVETPVDPANVTITESGDNYVVEVKNVTLVDGDTIKIFEYIIDYSFKFPYVRVEDIKVTVTDSNGANPQPFDAFSVTIDPEHKKDLVLTLKEDVAVGNKLEIYRDYSSDPLHWAPRAVGDDLSNPVPSFVGQKLNSLFFFSNRLGILSQDTVVMSQPSDYFNFFVGSAIAVSDSDPVDITASATKPATLKSALSTAKGLLLFAENSQFLVTSEDNVFGPSTIKINEISNYGYQSSVDPVETGVSIMFSTESSTFTKVFELALDSIDNRPVVSENTRIVPEYVPPKLKFVESSSNNSIVVFGDGSREVFVFKFYNATNERNQAGWSKWEFPAPVRSFGFDQDTAYIVMHNGKSCILAQLDMLDDPEVSAIRSLDRQFTPRLDLYNYKETLPNGSISKDTQSTKFAMKKIVLPAGSYVEGSKVTLAVTEGETDTEFYEFEAQGVNQKYISVREELADANFVIGLPYDMEIEFPAFYVLSDKKADRKNHPVVHTAYFDFYYSGRTEVVLKRKGYDDITTMGLESIRADLYKANSAAMDEVTTNALSVYCRGDLANITIKAHDPLPVSITSYRWEGSYNNRGVSII